LSWAIARAEVDEIDELNILHASMLAMKRALDLLSVKPDYAQIDGNRLPSNLPCAAEAIIKGDQSEACISAASIMQFSCFAINLTDANLSDNSSLIVLLHQL